jgi:hypothetical protein
MAIQLKRNDTKDTISYTMTYADGTPVNLTGATVRFVMGKGKTLITSAAATISSATAGKVEYTLKESDTLVAGNFNAEFEVTFSDSKVKTFPSDGYISLRIQPNVDDDQSTYIEDQIAYRVSDIQILKNSIQAQLDQFAVGASNEETAQARVEADNTVNTTLKARLDKKEAKFSQDIQTLSSLVAQKAKQTDLEDVAVSVKSFGAKGDWNGTTGADDTQAIKNAIGYLTGIDNATLKFPKAKGYVISDTIKIPNNINVIMDAPIIYTGTQNKPALEIGDKNSYVNYKKFVLWVEKQTQSTWSDYSSTSVNNDINVGIKLINLGYCDIHVTKVANFTVGLECLGANSKGFYYNDIYLGLFHNNKAGLEIVSENNGWPNGNVFHNGTMFVSNNINMSLDRWYINVYSRDNTYVPNSNYFNNTKFEAGIPTAPADITPVILDAYYHVFNNVRMENCVSTYFARTSTRSQYNTISIASDINNKATILDGNPTGMNLISTSFSQQKFLTERYRYHIFDSGNIKDKLYQNSGSLYGLHNMLFFDFSAITATYFPASSSLNPVIDSTDYVSFNNYARPGVYIDTKTCKEFLITGDWDDTNRLYFALLDEVGNVINSTSDIATTPPTYFNQFYFQYSADAGKTRTCELKVSDNVKQVIVMTKYFKNFKIYGKNKSSKVLKPVNRVVEDNNIVLLSDTGKRFKININDTGSISTTQITATNEK